jgi:hypothetical protein
MDEDAVDKHARHSTDFRGTLVSLWIPQTRTLHDQEHSVARDSADSTDYRQFATGSVGLAREAALSSEDRTLFSNDYHYQTAWLIRDKRHGHVPNDADGQRQAPPTRYL